MTLEYWATCCLDFLYLLPTWTLFHNSTINFFIKHLRILSLTSGFLPEGTFSDRKYIFWYGIPAAMDYIQFWNVYRRFCCNINDTALKLEFCYTIKTALQVGAIHWVLEATSFQLLSSTGIKPMVLLVTDCPGEESALWGPGLLDL